jgi:hypothetical protein
MYCRRIFVSCLAVTMAIVGICETHGQEGLLSPGISYYQPRGALNYPMLSGQRDTADGSLVRSTEINVGDISSGCGCGIHLLPALAQRLRDTFHYVFPYRGISRSRGLLFSERFYGGNCCGGNRPIPGVMYETGPIEIPTPATSVEEVPAKVAPTTTTIFPITQERVTTAVPIGNGVKTNIVRTVNYSVPNFPYSKRVPSIPDNPLRR